ncbi:MAG: DNA polymerase III subunit delta [Lentisphaerae bacterium]|nr:DNA polymerase III subunit delta [Lentisphaerota bacterium]
MAAAIHLVFGDDYLTAAKAKALVASSLGEVQDPLSSEVIDGQVDTTEEAILSLARVREAVGTLGFFGGRKVVWFKGVNFLTDTQVGRTEKVKSAVGRLAEMLKTGLPPAVVLIISAPRIDKRFALYKVLQGIAELHEFAVPDKPGHVRQYAEAVLEGGLKQAGITMRGEVRQVFLDRVGADTRTVLNELNKLATYLGSRKSATLDDIEAVTSASRDAVAWDIQDALGLRDLGRSISLLRRLLFQRESTMGMISLIENRLRDLIVYREAMDQGWLQVPRGGGNASWGRLPAGADSLLSEGLGRDFRSMHPFRLGILAKQAQNYTARELQRALALAMAAHRQLVTSSLPGPLVLEMLLIQILATRRNAPVRA